MVEQPRPAPVPIRRSAARETNLPALTGVRFMLALWVILYHLTGPRGMLGGWAQSLGPAAFSLARGGYLAVNIFFILSGFVLARRYCSTQWNRLELVRYGMRRFARIYPVYAVSLAIMLPYIWADRLPWTGVIPGPSKAAVVAEYVFLLQGWAGKLPVNWNTPAWSLSCEVFFYACFPAMMLMLTRRRLLNAACMILSACAAGLAVSVFHVPVTSQPLIHFADFLAGIAAAALFDILSAQSILQRRGYLLYAPALAAAVAVIARPDLISAWMSIDTSIRLLGAAAVVGLGLGGGAFADALSHRTAVHLGHASYALYILHIPILWWYKRWFGWLSGPLPAGYVALIYVGAAVGISSLVFRSFEEPLNRRLRNLGAADIGLRNPTVREKAVFSVVGKSGARVRRVRSIGG